ncbi:FIP (Fungus-Induced Protein) Related [Caenorhabditis elegans]|uniref:FIP (Fungus-Induced Protein) Related n=1 Tax=Caenorhabditis elegans TaxID=6239 RepID=B1Q267_CAEEL|nr:FIP (Fungus-Induced Protein) Related [Caenorhabditis elegans]CAQ16133.1 FIP (Fungus-Induced Protein) Related [Caenorhabditis elegans]|eukprot:NP_001122839.1 Uncharacterized protein CELE_C01G10.18 [Caenorhabditis elegans]
MNFLTILTTFFVFLSTANAQYYYYPDGTYNNGYYYYPSNDNSGGYYYNGYYYDTGYTPYYYTYGKK